jgi:O-antigen/teichoic acid export membrane protein
LRNGSDHLESLRDTTRAAKGAGIFLAGNLVGAPLTLFTQILIARLLGVEGFGLYELGFGAIRIFEIIGRLGLNVAGMRFVAMARAESPGVLKGVLISSLGISGGVSLCLGVILAVWAPFLAETVFRNPGLTHPLRWFAVGLPWITLMTVCSSLLLGFRVTQYTVYVRELAQPGAQLILVVVFYWLGFGLAGAVGALVLSHLAGLALGVAFLVRLCPSLTEPGVSPVWRNSDLLSTAIPLVLVALLNYCLAWTDSLLLGVLSTAAAVGVYRAAWRISSVMNLLLDATNSMYGPMVSELHSLSEKDRMANLYKATARWVSYAAVPIFLLLSVEAHEIMALFGKGFDGPGSWVLRILALGALINCITGGSGMTLIMIGKQNTLLRISMTAAAVNVGMNLLLIPIWGVIGAAISGSFSLILSNTIKVLAVLRAKRMHPFEPRVLRFLIYYFLVGVMLLMLKPLIPAGALSLTSMGALILFFSGLFMAKSKRDPTDELLLSKVVGLLRRRGSGP